MHEDFVIPSLRVREAGFVLTLIHTSLLIATPASRRFDGVRGFLERVANKRDRCREVEDDVLRLAIVDDNGAVTRACRGVLNVRWACGRAELQWHTSVLRTDRQNVSDS